MMQGQPEPNEFNAKLGGKTRTINVRLEKIPHVSWRCNSFAAAAMVTLQVDPNERNSGDSVGCRIGNGDKGTGSD